MSYKDQINVFEYLMDCISQIMHVIIWNSVNNEQIWLSGNYGSDFEQYLNGHKRDQILLLVNQSHGMAQIHFNFVTLVKLIGTHNDHYYMTNKCLNRLQLNPIMLLVNFWHELAQIMKRWISWKVSKGMTTFEFPRSEEVILSTVRSISNFTYLEWIQLYLYGMAPNFT